MSKHSFIRDDLFAVVCILIGGLLSVVLFVGWGAVQASDLHAGYSGIQGRCSGRVVTARYYEDEVHVPCDVHFGQQLNLLLPVGTSRREARYLADQFGGVLVGPRLVVDIDF